MLPFEFTGKVILGEGIGRSIGFPTANLDQIPSENTLKTGVYGGKCSIFQSDQTIKQDLTCLVYFGPRYVFGQKQNNFEVYIYNFNQDIYGLSITVTLLKHIRAPRKTKSLTELKKQLKKDKKQWPVISPET